MDMGKEEMGATKTWLYKGLIVYLCNYVNFYTHALGLL